MIAAHHIAGISILLASCGGEREPVRRVILVTCDTLRADHLGLYGYARPTSPGLDAFGADAAVFERAFTTAPLTGPAISSLLTGRLPEELGVSGGNRMLMPPEAETLAEVLSREGFETAAVVSNFVLRRPAKEAGDAGVQQGFARFDDRMPSREQNRGTPERTAEATTDAAIEWLSAPPARDRFFLWVHYQDPHGPYTPPEDLAALFRTGRGDEPELPVGKTQKGKGQIPAYQALPGETRPGSYVDRYDAEIRAFDRALGRLLAWLVEQGLYEGSLIVFTADHGESLGEDGYWFCHGENLQLEAVRVPLIVREPGAKRGVRWPGTVGHLDLWPTVLEAVGIPSRLSRGRSLLAPENDDGRIAAHTLGRADAAGRLVGVAGDSLRVVLEPGAPPRAFALRGGREEPVDPDAPEARELVTRWQALAARDAIPPMKGIESILDAEARRRMQGLGYVDGEEHR